MIKWLFHDMKSKIARLMGTDEAVKKVDAIDRRQRELGHEIRNIQMRIGPLRQLVERMRGENESHHHG